MGCGVSKFDLGEMGPRPTRLPGNVYAKNGKEEEADSLTSRGDRKSVSSIANNEKGLHKKANDKERGVQREMEPIDNYGRKNLSCILKKNGLSTAKVSDINQEANVRAFQDGEGHLTEDSILSCPRSPSFRVYCTSHSSSAGQDEDNDDEQREENQFQKASKQKGSAETQPRKSGRKARGIRAVFPRGGSSTMKQILNNVPGRSHASSTAPPLSTNNKPVANAV